MSIGAKLLLSLRIVKSTCTLRCNDHCPRQLQTLGDKRVPGGSQNAKGKWRHPSNVKARGCEEASYWVTRFRVVFLHSLNITTLEASILMQQNKASADGSDVILFNLLRLSSGRFDLFSAYGTWQYSPRLSTMMRTRQAVLAYSNALGVHLVIISSKSPVSDWYLENHCKRCEYVVQGERLIP